MESYEQIVSILALTMGASWASGINLYATLAVLGFSGITGSIELPPDLQVLQNPLVIGAAVLMYGVEFIVDKIPGLDTTWDGIHTFVRIPAGAMLAAGAIGDVGPAMEIAAAIMGGGMATATHATKAGTRAMINTSPEPFTNWIASVSEDVLVIGGLWTALHNPTLFIIFLVVFILLMIWLLPKIWRGVKGVFKFIGRLFGASQDEVTHEQTNELGTEPEPEVQSITGVTQGDKLQQIEKLKHLFDSGALTEEEFIVEKSKVLRT